MRVLLVALLLSPAAASAHVGHLGEVAGHDHWVAGIAIGAAVAVGVWGWWKGRKDEPAATAEDKGDEPSEEAGA